MIGCGWGGMFNYLASTCRLIDCALAQLKGYHTSLNTRLKYFHELSQNFKSKRIAMINKDRTFFKYNSGDLIYIMSSLTSQLHTAWIKIMIKYVEPIVVYKIVDPHNYLLMTLDWKISCSLFKYERLKPAILRTSEGNVSKLVKLKQIINSGLTLTL